MRTKVSCPFCGGDDVEDWGDATLGHVYKWMFCADCHAQGPRVAKGRGEDDDEFMQRVIEAWNFRVTPPLGHETR